MAVRGCVRFVDREKVIGQGERSAEVRNGVIKPEVGRGMCEHVIEAKLHLGIVLLKEHRTHDSEEDKRREHRTYTVAATRIISGFNDNKLARSNSPSVKGICLTLEQQLLNTIAQNKPWSTKPHCTQ